MSFGSVINCSVFRCSWLKCKHYLAAQDSSIGDLVTDSLTRQGPHLTLKKVRWENEGVKTSLFSLIFSVKNGSKLKKSNIFVISRAGQLFFLQEGTHINASYNYLKYPIILEQTSRHIQHYHWNSKKQLSNLTHHIHLIKSPERCTWYNNIFYFVIQKNLDNHQSILSYILS